MPNFTATTLTTNQSCRPATVICTLEALLLGTMLFLVGAIFTISAFAADINNINRAAAMEKQRNLNKINLSKVRHFDRRAKHVSSLKLDALPQSPRRGAYAATTNAIQAVSTGSRARRANSVVQASSD
ncbi:MAG: hypothetical protein PHP70_02955 [Gallionella sp.]|nr:hypothetical protein [Gallionella sp.]